MDNILTRIKQIADNENITISKFEQKIGASKGVLYKAMQNNTDIQSKWLVVIVDNFPQYNVSWLVTGKGEMLNQEKEVENNILNEPREEYVVGSRQLEFENKLLKETVSMLREKVEFLEDKIQFIEAEKKLKNGN